MEISKKKHQIQYDKSIYSISDHTLRMKFVVCRRGNVRFKKSIFHKNNINIIIIIIIIIIQSSSHYETTEKLNYIETEMK